MRRMTCVQHLLRRVEVLQRELRLLARLLYVVQGLGQVLQAQRDMQIG